MCPGAQDNRHTEPTDTLQCSHINRTRNRQYPPPLQETALQGEQEGHVVLELTHPWERYWEPVEPREIAYWPMEHWVRGELLTLQQAGKASLNKNLR